MVNLNQLLQLSGVVLWLDEARAETPVSRLSDDHTIGLSGYHINRLSDQLSDGRRMKYETHTPV